jgi:hypothetical protein
VSDEAILVVVLLGGIAVMVVALVRHQRRKEARLAGASRRLRCGFEPTI